MVVLHSTLIRRVEGVMTDGEGCRFLFGSVGIEFVAAFWMFEE